MSPSTVEWVSRYIYEERGHNDVASGVCQLPRERMWIEVIVGLWEDIFPVKRTGPSWWFTRRLSFLLAIWLTGLLVYTLDGMPTAYIHNLPLHLALFGNGMVILIASSGFRSFLEELPRWAHPVLRLDQADFKEFLDRAERWASRPLPPLLYAAAMTLMNLATAASSPPVVEALTAHTFWAIAITLFLNLLSGTGIWIVVSIWLVVFRLSRQPLDLRLSSQTHRTFRPLAMVSLYAAAFVFLSLSVPTIVSPPTSMLAESIYGFFILFGVLSFLIPFYNIHLILTRLKKRQLLKIKEDTSRLIQELNETLGRENVGSSGHQVTTITARLLALHIEEKTVEEAQEWPVDISFFTPLAGLAGMSAGRLILDLATRMLV